MLTKARLSRERLRGHGSYTSRLAHSRDGCLHPPAAGNLRRTVLLFLRIRKKGLSYPAEPPRREYARLAAQTEDRQLQPQSARQPGSTGNLGVLEPGRSMPDSGSFAASNHACRLKKHQRGTVSPAGCAT